jgi:polyisoprenyl-teichoic acid--peptidoglycan teichoic acid transferase
MTLSNKNRPDEQENETGRHVAGRRKRPRWHYVAYFLAILLVAEFGLVAMVIKQFNATGYFENIPIIKKLTPSAGITPPSLEPGDGSDNSDTADSTVDVNLAVGKTPIYAQTPIDPNVINILILGLDTRTPGGNGRSDVNMIVSINNKDKTIKLASILRDTLVPIEGHDWNRINSAYVFGGPGLTINTINDVYKMDIQRYVKMDFFAIKDIIDAVGGVDIKLTEKEITYLRSYGFSVSKGAGVKHLDGDIALAYARIRKIDSDFQRTQRQRNVMTAALGKVRGMGVIKAINLMTSLLPQVKTNISTNEAIELAKGVLAMGTKDLKQLALPIQGSWSNKKYKGMSIISVDFDKNTSALKSYLYGDSK